MICKHHRSGLFLFDRCGQILQTGNRRASSHLKTFSKRLEPRKLLNAKPDSAWLAITTPGLKKPWDHLSP